MAVAVALMQLEDGKLFSPELLAGRWEALNLLEDGKLSSPELSTGKLDRESDCRRCTVWAESPEVP